MFDRFTERARKTMTGARGAAVDHGHDYIATEHILLAILRDSTSQASTVLHDQGIDSKKLRTAVTKRIKNGNAELKGQLPFKPDAKTALEAASTEAQKLGHSHIGTEHLLLGVMAARGSITEPAFAEFGVTIDATRTKIASLPEEADRPAAGAHRPGWGHSGDQAVAFAISAAGDLGHRNVESEHLLLGILQSPGVAAQILGELGATPESVRSRIQELRGT